MNLGVGKDIYFIRLIPGIIYSVSVRYTIPADGNSPDHVEIDLPPPPYDSAPIFFVNGDLHFSTSMPPPAELRFKPPEYGDVSDKPPSYSSLCKVHTSSSESSNLPTNVEQAENITTNGSNE